MNIQPRIRIRKIKDGYIVGCRQTNIFANESTLSFILDSRKMTADELIHKYEGEMEDSPLEFLEHLQYLGFVYLGERNDK